VLRNGLPRTIPKSVGYPVSNYDKLLSFPPRTADVQAKKNIMFHGSQAVKTRYIVLDRNEP
jgi:hypothetical protein